jgi:hypothetical protein
MVWHKPKWPRMDNQHLIRRKKMSKRVDKEEFLKRFYDSFPE